MFVEPLAGLTVSKSSFFYETQPCSNQLRISWLPSASDAFIFGTAFNWGKNVLYDARFEQKCISLRIQIPSDRKIDGLNPIPQIGL